MADKIFTSPLIPSSRQLVSRDRATMTGVLSAVAGAPCGVQTRRGREGSFLVLVVGTLALLAVITIVYVALGNADTRTKAASQSRVQQDDVAPKVADWIATTIANDALATEFTGEVESLVATNGQADGPGRLRRETSDAPGVRPNISSAPGAPVNQQFDPTGTVNAGVRELIRIDANAGDRDFIVPASDPFLASMVPVNFKYQFATGDGGANELPDPSRPYLYDLDWLSISNFAPDGAFVNLDNLRGNWGASSLALRQNKTLYDVNGLPTDRLVFGDRGQQGEVADQNNPAHWTMYQQRAFQPGTLTSQWADADGDGMLDSRIFEMIDGQAGDGRRLTPSINAPGVRYFIAARAIDLSGMVNLTTASDFTTGANNMFVAGATPADVDLKRLLTQIDMYADQNPFGQTNVLAGYQSIVQSADPANLDGAATPDSPQNYGDYTESAAFRAGSSAYAALRLSLAASTPVGRDILDNNQAFSLAETDYQIPVQDTQLGIFAASLKNLNPNNLAELKRLQTLFGAPYPATGNLPAALTTTDWAAQRSLAWNEAVKRFQGGSYASSQGLGTLPGGLFTTADLGELLTRFGINSDERSAIEVVIGGRDATNGPLSTRFDPLRSNRPESVELIRFEVDPTTGIDMTPPVGGLQDRVMRLFGSDIRRFITPLNGARQLRSQTVTSNASTLSGSELKINLRAVLDEVAGRERGNLAKLYAGYAAGLAPFAHLESAWSPQQFGTQPLPSRTLFYGYRGPEAALLAAAHMAVNLKDFADADTRPSAATVVMSLDAAQTLDGANSETDDVSEPLPNYSPWFPGVVGLNLREVDVSWRQLVQRDQDNQPVPSTLARSNDDTVAPAVNVYGVEPQIFITQISTMTMYVDKPEDPIPSDPIEVKIETEFPRNNTTRATFSNDIVGTQIDSDENSEVAARIIAFKVVNPFDQPVELSGPVFSDGTVSRWFGGQYFDVATLNQIAVDSRGAVRPDSLREHQYIRVGEGEGARYYLLMELAAQVSGVSSLAQYGQPSPVNSTGTTGEFLLGFGNPPRDYPPVTLQPITLQAGETAILYAISEPPSRIADRFRQLGFPRPDVAREVNEFFTNQLAAATTPDIPATDKVESMRRIWIPLYAPTLPTGESDNAVTYDGSGVLSSGLQNLDEFVDVVPPDPAAETARSVTLWRADRRLTRERAIAPVNFNTYDNWVGATAAQSYANGQLPDGFDWTLPTQVFLPNDVRNDIMLDRFKVPYGSPFDSSIKLQTANGTSELELSDTDQRFDRDGATLITARMMRRPADPGNDFDAADVGDDTPAGVLPLYCIEPKYVDGSGTSDKAWNVADASLILQDADVRTAGKLATGPLYAGAPSHGDPTNPPFLIGGAFDTIEDAVNVFRTADPDWTLVADMSKPPEEWGIDPSTSGGRVFASTFGSGPQQATGVDGQLYKFYNEMYPSLLASGADRASDPTNNESPLIRQHMFRVQSLDRTVTGAPPVVLGSAKQILITLPDGTVIPQPDRNVPTEPDFTSNISTLRLTDLLLPLGLGPMEVPAGNVNGNWPSSNVYNPNNFAEARTRYTTLGEAVAIAMGFEVTGAALPANAYAQDPALWWAPREAGGEYRLPVPVRPISTEPLRTDASDVLMFDNGNLALDRFVPFVDLDGDGIPNAGTTFEPTWGLGITPAANVLEQFTIIEAPTGLSNRPDTNGSVAQRDYDARRNNELLTTAVPGLVNINTAPVQVLRTLPFVSPAPSLKAGVDQTDLVGATLNITNADRRSFENGTNSFDHSPFLDFRINAAPAPAPSVLDQAADIAPTLAAYRDLYPERFRRDTMVFMANRLTQLGLNNAVRNRLVDPDPDAPLDPLTFSGADGLANRISPMLWTWIDGQQASDWLPRLWSAENKTRERATGVPGVRSQPGFRSPGELIFARALWFEAASNESIGVAPLGAQAGAFRQQIVRGLPTNPDFLGYDQYLAPGGTPANRGLPAAFRGLDPVQGHTSDAQTTAAVANDVRSPNNIALLNVRNTMSEKLLVPGAMISSTTTRSDVYAVWFTIFGFREGDVGPAGSTEPLQPSVQRRFLMVVDRSNVTQLGQKPRIVLFKEVPM